MASVRLDKWISDSLGFSRSEARDAIRQGRVAVGATIERKPERRLEPDRDLVLLDGKELEYSPFLYYMMNKPSGVVCATEDRREKTVLDLLPPEIASRGVFPVGRLDKDTTGLLLLSNDGDFAHSILSPRRHLPKRYLALTAGTPDAADAAAFAEGMTLLDGTVCLPARLEVLGKEYCAVTVVEGQYHQVKRMLAARGKPVKSLKRVSIGGLALDDTLSPGEFRKLRTEELDRIFCPVSE